MQTYGRPISLSLYIGAEVAPDSRIIFSKGKRQEPLTCAWDKAPKIDYESVPHAHILHMQYATSIHGIPVVNMIAKEAYPRQTHSRSSHLNYSNGQPSTSNPWGNKII